MIPLLIYAQDFKNQELPIYGLKQNYHFQRDNGGKKTVINFWASWCTACVKELAELETLKNNNPSYNYLAINAGEKSKKIKKFIKKYNFSYKILIDKDKKFSKSMGVLELPRTMILDENLKILYNDKIPPKVLN